MKTILFILLSLGVTAFTAFSERLSSIDAGNLQEFNVPIKAGRQIWMALPPAGVAISTWNPEGTGSASLENVSGDEDAQAFVIRNEDESKSVMIGLEPPLLAAPVVAGKTYELTVSYLTTGTGSPFFELRLKNGELPDVELMEPAGVKTEKEEGFVKWKFVPDVSDKKWAVFKARFSVITGKADLQVVFQNHSTGAQNIFAVRRLEVSEVTL